MWGMKYLIVRWRSGKFLWFFLVSTFTSHRLNDGLLQCEMEEWDRVEQLFENFTTRHEERQCDAVDFFHSLVAVICQLKDEHVYVKMEAANGAIYTFRKRKVSPQQLCLTTMAVKSLKLALKLSATAEPSRQMISWRWYSPMIPQLKCSIPSLSNNSNDKHFEDS